MIRLLKEAGMVVLENGLRYQDISKIGVISVTGPLTGYEPENLISGSGHEEEEFCRTGDLQFHAGTGGEILC